MEILYEKATWGLVFATAIVLAAGQLAGAGAAFATEEDDAKKAGAVLVSGDNFKNTFADGEKNRYKSSNGGKGFVRYKASGWAFVNWGRGDSTGKWRADGNNICSKYYKIRSGREFCRRYYKVGDKKFKSFKEDGSLSSDITR